MIYSQTVIVLGVMQQHPEGLSLEELTCELRKRENTSEAVRYLLATNSLSRRLATLSPCLEHRDGKYYYLEDAKEYSTHSLTNSLLAERLRGQ